MEYRIKGKIIQGVGGLYTVGDLEGLTADGGAGKMHVPDTIECRARGVFRHNRIKPLVGDEVEVTFEDGGDDEMGMKNVQIAEILPRKNSLIRPPLANLDTVFVAMASSCPKPMPDATDKLLSILEFNKIDAVVVIGKCELDGDEAQRLKEIYTLAGYRVFVLSCKTGEGVDEIKDFVRRELCGKIAAFAGASGVGKSTLMNEIFPGLDLETSGVSEKIERGKNTTRTTRLFPLEGGGYLADTPGFSMLDFERFDFFTKEDLPETMREFREYLGKCRYTKCTHTKDEGCAVLEALRDGKIAKSRHDSYLELYAVLKEKKAWK